MNAPDQLWVLGDLYTFHLSTPELAVIEITISFENGPPLHSHRDEEETLYILSGTLDVEIEGRKFAAATGDFVHFPKRCLHTFRAVSQGGARVLVTISPGLFAQMFSEIGVKNAEEAADPVRHQQAIEKLLALSDRFGLYIPPPPQPSDADQISNTVGRQSSEATKETVRL